MIKGEVLVAPLFPNLSVVVLISLRMWENLKLFSVDRSTIQKIIQLNKVIMLAFLPRSKLAILANPISPNVDLSHVHPYHKKETRLRHATP